VKPKVFKMLDNGYESLKCPQQYAHCHCVAELHLVENNIFIDIAKNKSINFPSRIAP